MADQRKTARIRYMGGEIIYRYPDLDKSTFRRRLEDFRDASLDMAPAYAKMEKYLLSSIGRNFTQEGRPIKWKALQPVTIKERIRRGFGAGPILVRSGKLKRGFKVSYGSKVLSIGNKVKYFTAHQYGVPQNNLPARVMVVLLAQDKAQITRITREHLGIS